ncbi:MAG TPA: ABC transporter substrate-binding protein [Alcanivoracaceae bacterium]|nr:ABC transporter substrate-binding protein [Alcanivoracaceae bacterium]
MKTLSLRTAWQLAFVLFFSLASSVFAAQQPDEVIRVAVQKLTERIDAEREQLEKDEKYAQTVIDEELSDLVDFRRITRSVMGPYFNAATREQRNNFLETFRQGLINTYATGVTMYEGQNYKVHPLGEGDVRGNRARVQMEFFTSEGKSLPIAYTLTNTDGEWKVDNVIVNNLNLGRVFRDQFAQDMEEHGNDIDKVISNWSVDVDVEGVKAGQ